MATARHHDDEAAVRAAASRPFVSRADSVIVLEPLPELDGPLAPPPRPDGSVAPTPQPQSPSAAGATAPADSRPTPSGGPGSALPAGFFDDPVVDAAMRGVAPPDPESGLLICPGVHRPHCVFQS